MLDLNIASASLAKSAIAHKLTHFRDKRSVIHLDHEKFGAFSWPCEPQLPQVRVS
jgi:hypothetical protein